MNGQAAVSRVRPPVPVPHLRKDTWWVLPVTVVLVLGSFIVYSTWAAFQNAYYWAPPYLSPFYSPCLSSSCLHVTFGYGLPDIQLPIVGILSPAFLILWGPGLFRLTCYYYRKAYYRAFLFDPPACQAGVQAKDRFWAGKSATEGYRGERALFVLNNVHRYFLYASIIVVAFLWYEAFRTLFGPQGFQVSVGSLLWFLNIVLLSAYTFSCHSFRHLVGGNKDCYTCLRGGNARRKTYNFVSRLNLRHPNWAWYSLFSLVATDLYLRLLQAGAITDFVIVHFGG
jgi:hypothetical protein